MRHSDMTSGLTVATFTFQKCSCIVSKDVMIPPYSPALHCSAPAQRGRGVANAHQYEAGLKKIHYR